MNKRYKCILVIVISAFGFAGCGSHELENRSFPLAVGIEKEKEDCRAVFNFPVLSEVANENADGSYTSAASGKGTDFFFIEKNYEKSSSKQIDFAHNKVLILSEEFLEDEKKMEGFINYAKTRELMARNTYLFVTKMPMEDLFALDKNLEKPLGTYLEELLESDTDYKNKRIMTLGKLYDERENRMETLYIPVLGEQNQNPAVLASYVLKNGEPIGEVTVETSMESMFVQGKLRGFSYQDREGREWTLTNIKPSYRFEKNLKHPVVKVEVSCQAALENGQAVDWREQEKLEKQLGAELGKRLNQTAEAGLTGGYDITNSYKRLGNQYREAYAYYGKRGGYEDTLKIETTVRPFIVNSN